MREWIVDRFEEDCAVCEAEDQSMKRIARSQLPLECQEGDCLVELADGSIRLDRVKTAERKDTIARLMENLFE